MTNLRRSEQFEQLIEYARPHESMWLTKNQSINFERLRENYDDQDINCAIIEDLDLDYTPYGQPIFDNYHHLEQIMDEYLKTYNCQRCGRECIAINMRGMCVNCMVKENLGA